MKLTFLGATHEVTGSCYLLEACGKKVLIDCGMEQGQDVYENEELPIAPSQVDMVLLTHAHMDHSGKLPLLYKQGFQGQIFSTSSTADLCEIMLRDSAHIQMFEAEWKNRKGKRAGKEMVEPLYDMDDAVGVLACFVRCDYDKEVTIADGIRIRFVDAGHLLGSSSIEVWIRETQHARPDQEIQADQTGRSSQEIQPDQTAQSDQIVEKKIVFSGDIGNSNQPLIRDPQYLKEADYVVMESTYGDRSHERPVDYAVALAEVIQRTFDRGGNVVIPSFAVGRTQEMLYFIRRIKEEGLVKNHDGFEVWVDSPLAVEATNIFRQHMWSDFDEEALDLIEKGINPIGFAGLKTSVTSDDSRAINEKPEPKVILSASGMCDAGRIKHHLKHNLWRKESTILFVGYQASGTLGRALIEGAKNVKLFGEEIEVHAEICRLPGISGHADNEGLMRWIRAFEKKPQQVFVTHGEDAVCELFAGRLRDELGLKAYAPFSGTVYDLARGEFIKKTEGILIQKETTAGAVKVSGIFARLVAAGQRLVGVIRKNEGGANRDLERFTREIHALCDKWER